MSHVEKTFHALLITIMCVKKEVSNFETRTASGALPTISTFLRVLVILQKFSSVVTMVLVECDALMN